MSTYDKIAWLPLCGGLTGLGLVLSYIAMRRRGLGAGLRGAAWSLLPLAAYLTGAIEMFWKMGVAIGDFAKGFVFSPEVWSGIAVAGVAVVLFVVSGPLRRRRVKRGQDKQAVGQDGAAARHGNSPPGPRRVATTPPARTRSRRARARTRPTMTTTSGTSRTSCAATASPDRPASAASRGRHLRSSPPRRETGIPAKPSARIIFLAIGPCRRYRASFRRP